MGSVCENRTHTFLLLAAVTAIAVAKFNAIIIAKNVIPKPQNTMVTITKKEFEDFVQDIASQFEVNNAAAIAFDDEFTKSSYAILDNSEIVKLPIKVFNALYYNMGKNAIITVKRNAIVIDFVNKIAKLVPTKWVKRK